MSMANKIIMKLRVIVGDTIEKYEVGDNCSRIENASILISPPMNNTSTKLGGIIGLPDESPSFLLMYNVYNNDGDLETTISNVPTIVTYGEEI